MITKDISEQFISPDMQAPLTPFKRYMVAKWVIDSEKEVLMKLLNPAFRKLAIQKQVGYVGTLYQLDRRFRSDKEHKPSYLLSNWEQLFLGRFYEGDYGVEKDLVRAFAYYANMRHLNYIPSRADMSADIHQYSMCEIILPFYIKFISLARLAHVFNLDNTPVFAMEDVFSELEKTDFEIFDRLADFGFIARNQTRLIIEALLIRRTEIREYLEKFLPKVFGGIIIDDYMGFANIESLSHKKPAGMDS